MILFFSKLDVGIYRINEEKFNISKIGIRVMDIDYNKKENIIVLGLE